MDAPTGLVSVAGGMTASDWAIGAIALSLWLVIMTAALSGGLT
jgi:hypothetical protein